MGVWSVGGEGEEVMGWGAGVEGLEVSVREGELETTPTDLVRLSSREEANDNNNISTEKEKENRKNMITEPLKNRRTE